MCTYIHLFRDNENVHVHEMEGFKLPPFLLTKVQHYIRSLQSKQSHVSVVIERNPTLWNLRVISQLWLCKLLITCG